MLYDATFPRTLLSRADPRARDSMSLFACLAGPARTAVVASAAAAARPLPARRCLSVHKTLLSTKYKDVSEVPELLNRDAATDESRGQGVYVPEGDLPPPALACHEAGLSITYAQLRSNMIGEVRSQSWRTAVPPSRRGAVVVAGVAGVAPTSPP